VPTFHVENFGCRATQADGAALERQFESRGLSRAPSNSADLVILNTCTVTGSADQDARAAIRRVQRQNPLAKIIVTGCYAQRAPEEIAALPGVTAVIGNSHKHQLAEIALENLADCTRPDPLPPVNSGSHHSGSGNSGSSDSASGDSGSGDSASADFGSADFGWRSASSAAIPLAHFQPALAAEVNGFIPVANLTAQARSPQPQARLFVSDIFAHTELLAAPVFESANHLQDRTRPNLKVQDGCDNRCSFCVIPSVRGHSRSLPVREIIREVNTLVGAGYREVVISGINLGRWGRDLALSHTLSPIRNSRAMDGQRPATNDQRLESLIRTILAETRLEKLRISSVEPMDWTDDLIALVASSPRIAKHAHVPLQSGSDAVLRRMHRKYRPWHYREKIEKIHAAMPIAAIGADVMTGFPCETDAEFEATRRLIEDLPFTYLHVFTFSARPGTPAAAMPNQVPVHIARERNKILRDLATEKKQAFMRSFVGKQLEAITLAQHSPDGEFTEALTDNYQKFFLKGRHAPNRWINAHVEHLSDGVLVGSTSSSSHGLSS